MASSDSARVKDPVRVKGGYMGSDARWHGLRVQVRLDGLTAEQRKLVIDMVESMRKANQQ